MAEEIKVLFLEDNPHDVELMLRELRREGYQPDWVRVETAEEFAAELGREYDIILSDYDLPQYSAPAALEDLKASGVDLPFIIVTGAVGEDVAIMSIKQGAADYLLKDRLGRLGSAVRHALEEKRLRRESHRAQEALASSERKHRELFEDAPHCYLSVRARDGMVLDCNRAATELLGYDREILRGMSIMELAEEHPAQRRRLQDVFRALKQGRSVRDEELRLRRSDGSEVWIGLTVKPVVGEGGETAEGRALAVDLSERKRLESQLRQSQKMEAIGTLAGGIAHDFNNILAAIIGYTELASGELGDDHPGRQYLAQVLMAGRRAKNLVQQILSFSRQTEQEARALMTKSVVKEALKLLRASVPTTIEIRADVEREEGLILAEPTQIHQLIMNLCSNAAHAMMDKGGTLEVSLDQTSLNRTRPPQYEQLPAGRYQRLRVRDTGQGMDSEVLQRIFDPFFTTKAPGEGTGMGLAVVHGIVTSHGGGIRVESEPGRGSLFEVVFPVLSSAEAAELEPPPGSIPHGEERILFVDDEEALAELGRRMLAKLGYDVETVTSGTRALEMFIADPDRFDLIITDQTMPGLTGSELACRMLEIRPDLPIILCTGFSHQVTEAEALSLGIQAFIMKPLVVREMAEKVRSLLDRSGVENSPEK